MLKYSCILWQYMLNYLVYNLYFFFFLFINKKINNNQLGDTTYALVQLNKYVTDFKD